MVGFTLPPWPSARWQGEREGRTETPERHQGSNAQHSTARFSCQPQSHHSPLTITSASAVPTTCVPYTSHIHHVLPSPPIPSPATPRPKTKRLDTPPVCLTGGLRGTLLRLHNSAQSRTKAFMPPRPWWPSDEDYIVLHLPLSSVSTFRVKTCHQIRLPA